MALLPSSYTEVVLKDGAQVDPFGRLRISQPRLLLSATPVHDSLATLFDTVAAGSGTVTANLDGTISLAVGTGSGAKVQRRGHTLWTYRAGQGFRCAMTFVLPAAQANQRVEVGFYDGTNQNIGGHSVWGNGICLRRDGTGAVTLRVTKKDVVVDSAAQSAWNLDKMDGSGVSGITLDWTKAQILLIDLQALYVGRVRVGFEVGGRLYYVHEFRFANSLALPYLASANMAPWYAIENTGATGVSATLLQICAEVSREGGLDEPGRIVSVQNDITTSPVAKNTAYTTLLAFRLFADFPSAILRVVSMVFMNLSNEVLSVALLRNPTLSGALTWGGAVAAGTRMVEISTTQVDVTSLVETKAQAYLPNVGTPANGSGVGFDAEDLQGYSFSLAGASDVGVLVAKSRAATNKICLAQVDIAEID